MSTATPNRHDRRDIFELFDYHKIYEISVNEVSHRKRFFILKNIIINNNYQLKKLEHRVST